MTRAWRGPWLREVPAHLLTSTMALQQAQMLLSMNSLEAVNAGVQQNNTESFAVALCHLAELHAEQVGRWPGRWASGTTEALPFLFSHA